MLLSDILSQLTYSELSQYKIGGLDGAGAVLVADYPRIISTINMGLVELFTRFPLKNRSLILQMYSTITDYILHTDNTVSIGTNPTLYILDSTNLFTNDILRISSVYNDADLDTNGDIVLNTELPLNNEFNIKTLKTPTPTTLKVYKPNDLDKLTVNYRATPTLLDTGGVDLAVYIDLPMQYLEALLVYVAFRLNIPKNSEEGANSQFSAYNPKFEALIISLTNSGLINKDEPANLRIENNGWE